MRIEPLLLLLAALLTLVACDDLTVELDDDSKDQLAVWVEGGGQPPPPPLDLTPGPTTDLPHLDHLAFTALLAAFNRDGFIDYDGLLAAPDALELLDAYLQLLAEADPDALDGKNERFAFWLNAYNAHMLRQVTRALPDNPAYSVEDDGFAVFKARVHAVGGRRWSLDQIEHLILRGDAAHASSADLSDDDRAEAARLHDAIFDGAPPDPRLHVGLNCASFSCPLLPAAAFTAPSLDAQLDAQSAAFVADPARGAGPDGISMLFSWFATDFGAGGGEAFIRSYRDDVADVRFEVFLGYDWSLNRAR